MTSMDVERINEILGIATSLEALEDWESAAKTYQKALALFPLEAELWFRMGCCLARLEATEDAALFLEKASMLAPGTVKYDLKLGDILISLRHLSDAIGVYKRVKAVQPKNISANNNIGIALKEAGLLDEAILAMRYTLQIAPEDPVVLSNYGAVLLQADRSDEAVPILQKAISYNPDNANTWSTYAVALHGQLAIENALSTHQKALTLAPTNHAIHYNYAMTLLLNGDYQNGFSEFEHRRNMPDHKPREFDGQEWAGEDLNGQTILIHAEQGIGDAIQFARFLPELKRLGANTVFSIHQSLVRLGSFFEGVSEVIGPNDAVPTYDFQLPLLSLPKALRIELSDVKRSTPYLNVKRPAKLIDNGKNNFKIGLVWAGNPQHANDKNRSCPFEFFSPFFSIPKIDWHSLQVGQRAGDLAEFDAPIADLSMNLGDFADTAAQILELDLVICVDTSVAHLTGAMGTNVWVMLPYAPDWRWLLNRDDTPWYSTARLFRQPKPKDWQTVIANIRNALVSYCCGAEI
jgi:Flp pilus assembly protein TadD